MQLLGRESFLRRAWFQTLVGGLVLFYLLVQTLRSTGDPNFFPSVIVLGAFLVPVVLVTYLYEHFPVQDLPLPSLALSFLFGGALGAIVAARLEFATLRELGPLALLGVGLIEEGAKLLFPAALYLRGRYRSEADGIVIGVATGMGFAALETMGYAFVGLLASRGSLAVLEDILLVRGLLSPAGHAAWTGLVCAVAWRERIRTGQTVPNSRVLGAFVTVVLLHTLWDTFQTLPGPTLDVFLGQQPLSLLVALVSLTLLVRRIQEASIRRAPAR